ncbi:MAG: MFS transporter [Gemmatimonadaceae bacterium]|nr:MFS transporter [Gemmatimonadaceae bacterium]
MTQALVDSARSSNDNAGPPIPYTAWYGLVVLTLINLLNYLDRMVVPPLGESLMHSELQLTGEQFGLLASAFLVVYMVAAPLVGTVGDRRARPPLLALGIALWSIATALGGLAWSFGSLVAARASVGIGEAVYGSIAPALLADYFPERLRGRVFAIFFAATPVGSALGYIVGGLMDHHYGWRAAFFVAGAPGIVLAALALWLAEPRRHARGAPATAATAQDPGEGPLAGGIRTYAALLRNRLYLLTVLGYAAYTFAIGGIAVWMPTFLERVRHVPRAQASVQLGAVLVITGFVGTFIGGWLTDRLLERTRRAALWVSAVATLLAVPCAYLALAAPDRAVYWPALIVAEVLIFICTSPVNAAIVSEVPATVRAAAMALCIFTIHTLGDVPSPPIIGAIADASSLEHGVMLIPVAVLVAGVIWLAAARLRVATAPERAPA